MLHVFIAKTEKKQKKHYCRRVIYQRVVTTELLEDRDFLNEILLNNKFIIGDMCTVTPEKLKRQAVVRPVVAAH